MEITTTTAPVAKRNRGSVILTDRLCERRVSERTRYYDRKCRGLYVSMSPTSPATFFFKFTDKTIGKQRTAWLGTYNPETFTCEHARSRVYALKGLDPAALAATFRDRKAQAAKHGKTVDELITERITWMKTPVRKPDGEMRPRLESWKNTASHLRRFLSPTLGKKLASEVTRGDITEVSDAIVAGRYGGRRSVANARHFRRAASGLFRWALHRDYVTANPCSDLEKLDKEPPRTRMLSPEEIKIFWKGLDREDLMGSWDRRTRLALKFALISMLRSQELMGAGRDELVGLDGDNPVFVVPLRRVKKRRIIQAPLTGLAVEIIKEALRDNNKDFVFASPLDNTPLHRHAMATALRGTKYTHGPRKGHVKAAGICALLGLKPFTPHDLRRTGASMARRIGQPVSKIALCLDHRVTHEDGVAVPQVTSLHYVHAEDRELLEKREVLGAWEGELRRIIGEPALEAEADMRLAA